MAPENLKNSGNQKKDWSTDVWGIGVIVLEILQSHPINLNQTCRVTTVLPNIKPKVSVGAFSSRDNSAESIAKTQKEFLTRYNMNIKMIDTYQILKT